MRAASSPDSTSAPMPVQYAPPMPMAWISAAATNGPTNRPIRITPPSVESARARKRNGTASVR